MTSYATEPTTENRIFDLCASRTPSNVTFLPLKNSQLFSLQSFPVFYFVFPLFFLFFPQEPKSNISVILSHRRVYLFLSAWTPPDTRIPQPQPVTRFFPCKDQFKTFAMWVVEEHRFWSQIGLDPSGEPV